MAEDAKTSDKPDARPLPPIAGKASDLEALRSAVVDAANVGAALWFSYLFALLYFLIAVGGVTHRNLLFESPVKLPILNVDLPLVGFFTLGPAVFLVMHAYVLLHFAMLADKVGVFHAELQRQIADDGIRTRLRRQLPSNIFVQFLAGPREVRTGLMGLMLRLIAFISLVIGPLALLAFFELQFLPYHHEVILWWQRIAVVVDLALLWALWPSVARGETAWIGWQDFRRPGVIVAAAASLLPVGMVFAVATFPGEWLHRNPVSIPFIPEMRDGALHLTTPHDLLVAGDVDMIARKPTSLWANRLVWPNLEQPPASFSLRGRRLEGAVLLAASLKGVDFTGARLEDAILDNSDLREATLVCAEPRARFGPPAEGEGEKKTLSCTQLQRATLRNARLEKAKLDGASLEEAVLDGVRIQGATLAGANLSGASFEGVDLGGMSLRALQASGVNFRRAQLQGAVLDRAKLQGANFRQAQVQGASFYGADLRAASFEETQGQAANFEKAKLDAAMLIDAQFQGAYFFDASFKGARFGREAGVVPRPAQLQGTDFDTADLDAAYFNTAPVWRSNARELRSAKGVQVHEPITERKSYGFPACGPRSPCDWSAESFAALKQVIETRVPAGTYRDEALERIARLDPAKPADDEAPMAASWSALAVEPKPAGGDFDRILAGHYRAIGCDPKNMVYPLRGIIARVLGIFEGKNDALMQMLETFERDPNCENARGLTAHDRQILATMYDAARKLREPAAR